MKRILILIVVLLSSIVTYGQTKERDLPRKKNKSNIDITNDCDMDCLTNKVESLNEDIKDLKKKLEKKNINKLEADIDIYKDSLVDLRNEFKSLSGIYSDSLKNEFLKGKNEVTAQILNFYKDKDIDGLIENTALNYLERDLKVLENQKNSEIHEELEELHYYLKAELIFNNKFNLDSINKATVKIKSFSDSKNRTSLTKNLKEYEFKVNGLNELIDKIIKLDKEFSSLGNKYVREDKMKKIFGFYSYYFYNYFDEMDFLKYPYITNIITEILNTKFKDVDADIEFMKSKIR